MSERIENLIIGTKGWVFDDWVGDFYPEDMPEDWQLDYYSNQFKCTLVAEEMWQSWDTDSLEEIFESLDGDFFAFVFELKAFDGKALSRLAYIREKLGDLAYGVLVIEPTQEALTQVQKALPDYRLTVCSSEVHLPGWHFQWEGQQFSGTPLVVTGLHNQKPSEAKEMLEAYCRTFSQDLQGGLLIVDGEVPAKALQDLKLVAELLGC